MIWQSRDQPCLQGNNQSEDNKDKRKKCIKDCFFKSPADLIDSFKFTPNVQNNA